MARGERRPSARGCRDTGKLGVPWPHLARGSIVAPAGQARAIVRGPPGGSRTREGGTLPPPAPPRHTRPPRGPPPGRGPHWGPRATPPPTPKAALRRTPPFPPQRDS